jgi:hypothetical protein
MALRMVEAGFTGPSDGVNTTFSLVLGEGFSPEVAVAELGQRWLLLEGYLKLYPTARYAHSAIDALHDALARSEGPLAPAEIERIDVRAYKLAAFLSQQEPTDWFGTRFSIPFALATLLVGGRDGLAAFSDEAVADPAVRALARRVHVVEAPDLTAQYPALQRVDLRLTLRDGRVIEGACHITSGEPQHPRLHAEAQTLRGMLRIRERCLRRGDGALRPCAAESGEGVVGCRLRARPRRCSAAGGATGVAGASEEKPSRATRCSRAPSTPYRPVTDAGSSFAQAPMVCSPSARTASASSTDGRSAPNGSFAIARAPSPRGTSASSICAVASARDARG